MGRKPGDTRERLLCEALRLFAESGYDNVRMADIAATLGHSAPAIYKHYSNKQALFCAVVERCSQGFDSQLQGERECLLGIACDSLPGSTEEWIARLLSQARLMLEGGDAAMFRRLLLSEQFRMPELAAMYNKRYVDDELALYETAFRRMMDAGMMKAGDARALAIAYYAPVQLLIGVCDREPERAREALQMLDTHVRFFCLKWQQ